MNGFSNYVTVVSLGSLCVFSHVFTVLFQKAVDVVFRVLSQRIYKGWNGLTYTFTAILVIIVCDFPPCVTALFQKAVNVISHVLPLHI